ncbi:MULTISPECIES: glycosyltransferase family 2 protein [unclassified Pigmentiphaga]|uniref:glycosyltransferase family 2 protein n=1 Tax=unclassified Pigmentiphaga TaxID=2626614 RepID=UPI000B40E5B9|nr:MULTISPECIES: glycosyltransferase family 2 protein [unclassified Pigmentiphaga]OVZ62380.1 capsular biosynthesis protein [Pigmentiphaga sp. NML030171]
MNEPPRIAVCIATYRRAERLDALLGDLAGQTLAPVQVVVVDNDPAGSARAVVEARRATFPAPLVYDVQPEKNISLTRNRCVAHARADWLAFVDDDERVGATWLQTLHAAARDHAADGVLAPVVPVVPTDAPAWIRRGGFYDGPRMATGSVVPLNVMRIGNALIAARWLAGQEATGPFDPSFGLTGGEDGDLLMRLVGQGARIVWCDEAVATEDVVPSRLRLKWILARALRGGQDYARHFLEGKLGGLGPAHKLLFFARALAQALAALLLALVTLPAGMHRSAHWLARACANAGKLSVLAGWHYREYA